MSKITSDQILERLHAWGVRRVYGYPGDGINGLMGAFERIGDQMQFVQARHEKLAAFAACASATAAWHPSRATAHGTARPPNGCRIRYEEAMRTSIAVAVVALATACGGAARATPLEQLRDTPASMLEFGSFRLETSLVGVKDWPFPIEGAAVTARSGPEQIEIVIAVRKVGADAYRAACVETLRRVRRFLYVDADGAAPMGRSGLANTSIFLLSHASAVMFVPRAIRSGWWNSGNGHARMC